MKQIGLLLMVLLSLAGPTHAKPFTSLEEAVGYTLSENYTLRASAQNITTAEAQTRVAESARLPEVDLSYAAQATDNPLDAFAERLNTRSVRATDFDPDRLNEPDTSTLFSGRLGIRYSLYNGGRTEAGIESATHSTEAARLEYLRVSQLLAFNTINRFYAAQAAELGQQIAKDAEAAAHRHARTTRQLVRQDRTVESDQLTAEVNHSSYQSLTAQSATAVKLGYTRLKTAMGMPQTENLSVRPLNLHARPLELADVERYEQGALGKRLDLQALESDLAAAQAQVQSARADFRPQIDLMADTTLYEDNPFVNEPSWRVMGVVSKDLYTGGRTRGKVAAARSRVETIRFQIESLRQGILGEVRAAYDRVSESLTRLEIARGNVTRARRNVRLITERYGQGRTILIDLLGAEQRLVEARNEELEAQRSLLSGIASLSLAEGSLDPDSSVTYLEPAR